MTVWNEYKIRVVSEDVEKLSQLLIDWGSNGVVHTNDDVKKLAPDEVWGERPDHKLHALTEVTAYFKQEHNILSQLKEAIKNLYAANELAHLYEVQVKSIQEADWAHEWEKYYHAVAVGKHIKIVPIWEKEIGALDEESTDELLIYLDPGLAFGTGTHPTTQLCVKAIEKYQKQMDTVYDVGTGSGILAIISAKLGAGCIRAFDYDEQAVDSAQANAKLNQLTQAIDFQKNDLLQGIEKPADLIIANILEPIIRRLIPMVPPLLKRDGKFIISGILAEQFETVANQLKMHRFSILETNQQGDWISIIACLDEEEN